MNIKNIFLTGTIHIGKSTIITRIIDNFPNLRIGGLRTRPVYENNIKKGFMFESLDGTGKIFAHTDWKINNQFDIYKFDYSVFEKFGVLTLQQALLNSDLILIDEIGMMEKQADMFCQMIVKCLNAPQLVLGAFQKRATWFLQILIERADTKIFLVSEDTRDSIPDRIISLIDQNLQKN